MKEESNKETILVRVVKGNYKSKETLFLSEPMTISNAMNLIKEIVPTLPPRGEGTLLVSLTFVIIKNELKLIFIMLNLMNNTLENLWYIRRLIWSIGIF